MNTDKLRTSLMAMFNTSVMLDRHLDKGDKGGANDLLQELDRLKDEIVKELESD